MAATSDDTVVTFTNIDVENSGKFADYNYKISILGLLMKKAPHLASHLEYTVRSSTEKQIIIYLILLKIIVNQSTSRSQKRYAKNYHATSSKQQARALSKILHRIII